MSERLKLWQQLKERLFRQTPALKRVEKKRQDNFCTLAAEWAWRQAPPPHYKHTLLCFMHMLCNLLQSTGSGNCQRLEINSGALWSVSSHRLTSHPAAVSPNQSKAGYRGNLNPRSFTVIRRENEDAALEVQDWGRRKECKINQVFK